MIVCLGIWSESDVREKCVLSRCGKGRYWESVEIGFH